MAHGAVSADDVSELLALSLPSTPELDEKHDEMPLMSVWQLPFAVRRVLCTRRRVGRVPNGHGHVVRREAAHDDLVLPVGGKLDGESVKHAAGLVVPVGSEHFNAGGRVIGILRAVARKSKQPLTLVALKGEGVESRFARLEDDRLAQDECAVSRDLVGQIQQCVHASTVDRLDVVVDHVERSVHRAHEPAAVLLHHADAVDRDARPRRSIVT